MWNVEGGSRGGLIHNGVAISYCWVIFEQELCEEIYPKLPNRIYNLLLTIEKYLVII